MFFILSKVLSFIVMPLGWFWVWGIFVSKRFRLSKKWIIIGVFLLAGTSNRFLVGHVMHFWEKPSLEVGQLPLKKVAIVLTGGLFSEESSLNNLYLGTHADRMFQALRLYQQGKVKRILITGGSLENLFSDQPSEAELAQAFFHQQGVPIHHIWLENQARNTHENAIYSIEILQQKGIQPEEVYVVTSALHMRRALACFKKDGWEVDFVSANPWALKPPKWRWIYLLPDYFTFYQVNQLMHESIGWAMYALMGYV